MDSAIATFPDLEFPVVVTTVALPIPQNATTSTVTSQPERGAALDRVQVGHLNAVVQNITDLLSEYLRYHSGFANSSCAVTYSLTFQPLSHYEVPARRTPFGHLNFLASPVEGLYFDVDDIAGS